MPLFESQQAQTERLFITAMLCAHERARSLHGAPWLHICEGVIWAGSVVASQSIEYYQPLQMLWGKGDEEKAAALTKVFSLAMLSSYLRPAEGSEAGSSDEREAMLREWAGAILELFEDDSPESLEHFVGVDRQYAYDRAEARTCPLSDVIYFSDAVVALGGGPTVKVTAGELPIRNYTHDDLIARGVVSAEPDFFSWTEFKVGTTMVFVRAQAKIERGLAQYYQGTPEAEVHLRRAEEIERGLKETRRKLKQFKQD